jgi:molybdenum cofactor biosynthesis enzyme MoaA
MMDGMTIGIIPSVTQPFCDDFSRLRLTAFTSMIRG